MSDEHWNEGRIKTMLSELDRFKDLVAVSGGYAWHIMSPPHEEKRSFHDHKDIDIFVDPTKLADLLFRLNDREWSDDEVPYGRQWTKYDEKSPGFYRHTAYVNNVANLGEPLVKVMLDIFTRPIPSIQVNGYNVVNPPDLLPLYEHSHSSKDCVAVQAALKLVAKGISPVGRPELIGAK